MPNYMNQQFIPAVPNEPVFNLANTLQNEENSATAKEASKLRLNQAKKNQEFLDRGVAAMEHQFATSTLPAFHNAVNKKDYGSIASIYYTMLDSFAGGAPGDKLTPTRATMAAHSPAVTEGVRTSGDTVNRTLITMKNKKNEIIYKKGEDGKYILNKDGKKVPVTMPLLDAVNSARNGDFDAANTLFRGSTYEGRKALERTLINPENNRSMFLWNSNEMKLLDRAQTKALYDVQAELAKPGGKEKQRKIAEQALTENFWIDNTNRFSKLKKVNPVLAYDVVNKVRRNIESQTTVAGEYLAIAAGSAELGFDLNDPNSKKTPEELKAVMNDLWSKAKDAAIKRAEIRQESDPLYAENLKQQQLATKNLEREGRILDQREKTGNELNDLMDQYAQDVSDYNQSLEDSKDEDTKLKHFVVSNETRKNLNNMLGVDGTREGFHNIFTNLLKQVSPDSKHAPIAGEKPIPLPIKRAMLRRVSDIKLLDTIFGHNFPDNVKPIIASSPAGLFGGSFAQSSFSRSSRDLSTYVKKLSPEGKKLYDTIREQLPIMQDPDSESVERSEDAGTKIAIGINSFWKGPAYKKRADKTATQSFDAAARSEELRKQKAKLDAMFAKYAFSNQFASPPKTIDYNYNHLNTPPASTGNHARRFRISGPGTSDKIVSEGDPAIEQAKALKGFTVTPE